MPWKRALPGSALAERPALGARAPGRCSSSASEATSKPEGVWRTRSGGQPAGQLWEPAQICTAAGRPGRPLQPHTRLRQAARAPQAERGVRRAGSPGRLSSCPPHTWPCILPGGALLCRLQQVARQKARLAASRSWGARGCSARLRAGSPASPIWAELHRRGAGRRSPEAMICRQGSEGARRPQEA